MKENVSFGYFCDRFKSMDRDNNFSYDGKRALFDYIEQYEEDCGKEIELYIIALCCEYNEYENIEEFWGEYDKEEYSSLEKLEEYTQVIRIENSDGFIILAF